MLSIEINVCKKQLPPKRKQKVRETFEQSSSWAMNEKVMIKVSPTSVWTLIDLMRNQFFFGRYFIQSDQRTVDSNLTKKNILNSFLRNCVDVFSMDRNNRNRESLKHYTPFKRLCSRVKISYLHIHNCIYRCNTYTR